MGRQRLPKKHRRAIRDRLNRFIRERYRSNYDFCKRHELPSSTVSGWLNAKEPRMPDTPFLVKFAREHGLSVDWLLFGDGPELRATSVAVNDFAVELRTQVVAEIKTRRAPGTPEDALTLEVLVPDGQRLLSDLAEHYCERIEDIASLGFPLRDRF